MIRQEVKTKKVSTFHFFILLIIFLMMTLFIQNCSLPLISNRKPGWQPPQQPPTGSQPPGAQYTSTYAFLNINTEPPGCQVYLDGEMVGLSPLSLENLEPKQYTVELILRGYKTRERLVALYRGKTKSIDVLMEVVDDQKMKTSPDSE
ncbi:PEGA domain-containing protein [candidate division KSB1 bacterium]|nr:PEGA domain-containing protein [candidate division KSB1 bacterium]